MTRRFVLAALFVALARPPAAWSQAFVGGLQVWRVRGGMTVIHFGEDGLRRLGMSLASVEQTARTPPFVGTLMDPPRVAFAIEPSSTLEFTVAEGIFVNFEDVEQPIRHRGGFTLWLPPKGDLPAARLELRDFVIAPARLTSGALFDPDRDRLYLRDGREGSPLAFHLEPFMRTFIDLSLASQYAKDSSGSPLEVLTTLDDGTSLLWIYNADLKISEAAAEAVGRPELAGLVIGMVESYGTADLVGRRMPTDAEIAAIRESYPRAGSGPRPGSRRPDRP